MAKRGRPYEQGLEYFPKMVNFYDDDRIFDLLDAHGPLGVVIYDCILCIVYKNGYYAEMPLEKLSRMIIKMIGSKWVRNKEAVVQVILFCADIGLLDDGLLKRGVITSAGIQKRFYRISIKLMRRRLYDDRYWLLESEDDAEALLSAPKNIISSEENRINAEENRIVSEEKPYKRKENKSIYIPAQPERYFDNPELDEAFKLYVTSRKSNGDILNAAQIKLLRDELSGLSDKDAERTAIVKKATVSGWKSFWPLKKQADIKTGNTRKKNGFNNFKQRDNDTDSLEKKLMEKRTGRKA